jgi:hypothetical protein
VDGITYTYDPTGSTGVSVTGGTSQGTYDPATHQLTVRTDDGGTLVVNMNTGGYSYTPRPTVTTPIVDGFDFVLIDKDGDTAGASVTFNVSREAEAVVTLTSTSQSSTRAPSVWPGNTTATTRPPQVSPVPTPTTRRWAILTGFPT